MQHASLSEHAAYLCYKARTSQAKAEWYGRCRDHVIGQLVSGDEGDLPPLPLCAIFTNEGVEGFFFDSGAWEEGDVASHAESNFSALPEHLAEVASQQWQWFIGDLQPEPKQNENLTQDQNGYDESTKDTPDIIVNDDNEVFDPEVADDDGFMHIG